MSLMKKNGNLPAGKSKPVFKNLPGLLEKSRKCHVDKHAASECALKPNGIVTSCCSECAWFLQLKLYRVHWPLPPALIGDCVLLFLSPCPSGADDLLPFIINRS